MPKNLPDWQIVWPSAADMAQILRDSASFYEKTGLRGSVSHQSLGYLSKPCRLDISAAREALGWSPEFDFWNKKRSLANGRKAIFSKI